MLSMILLIACFSRGNGSFLDLIKRLQSEVPTLGNGCDFIFLSDGEDENVLLDHLVPTIHLTVQHGSTNDSMEAMSTFIHQQSRCALVFGFLSGPQSNTSILENLGRKVPSAVMLISQSLHGKDGVLEPGPKISPHIILFFNIMRKCMNLRKS